MPLNQIHHQCETLHHHHHHHLDSYPTRPSMDNHPPDLPSPSGTRKVELQGPRPTPLRVSKGSHKITKHKPPLHPKHHHHRQETVDAVVDNRQPVIIYAVSPKVIHADPSNFMSIVQRLTGNTTTTTTTTTTTATTTNYNDEGDTGDFSVAAARGQEIPISPAARFAVIERATISPSSQRGRNHQTSDDGNGLMGLVGFDEQLQQPVPGSAATGILSPAPGNLPVISSAMFSAPVDMQAMFGVQDVLSPLMFGHSFLSSPTGFLSPTLSPTLDFSNLFDNRFY